MEIKILFYKKIKTKLKLFTITERGQRINRTTEHLENYLLGWVVQSPIKLTQG